MGEEQFSTAVGSVGGYAGLGLRITLKTRCRRARWFDVADVGGGDDRRSNYANRDVVKALKEVANAKSRRHFIFNKADLENEYEPLA
jgi:hypothetical protein